jgi:hypothetical protein
VDAATLQRELPVDLVKLAASLRDEERNHTVATLPRVALLRATYFVLGTWDAPVVALILAIVGLACAPASARVGVATVGTLFVGYLAHVTWPDWTIYYMEVAPVLVFLTACGMAWVCATIARAPSEPVVWRRVPRATIATVAACLLLLVGTRREAATLREMRTANQSYMDRFRTMLDRAPAYSVLFVRYGPRHSSHLTLITNGPDWERAPVWVVADRGHTRNAALLALARGRQGLIFDEGRGQIDLYDPASLIAPRTLHPPR